MRLSHRLLATHATRDAVLSGIALGVVFGLWNLVVSILNPVAEDSPAALLTFYGPMFILWGAAGFIAFGESRRLRDATRCGAIIALVTFVVFTIFVGVRDNLLLEALTRRTDWQNLMVRFHDSGFESLRLYVNYIGVTGAPLKLTVATCIGAVMGFAGGLAHRATSWRLTNEEF